MEEKEFNYINVIPLVDIMLVLLTIVLTTATFVVQGEIPVDLPSAQSSKERKDYRAVDVTIKEDGSIYLGSKEVELSSLQEELKSADKETVVNIRADRRVSFGRVVEVMDILSKLGLRNVNFVVKKDEA